MCRLHALISSSVPAFEEGIFLPVHGFKVSLQLPIEASQFSFSNDLLVSLQTKKKTITAITGYSLVSIVYLRGDLLFELSQLVLRERAGQNLGPPFDEVADHVADRVEHLALVPLSDKTLDSRDTRSVKKNGKL